MPKTKFVDYRTVKAAITMEQVLSHYRLIDQFKRGTDSLSGPCPIHNGGKTCTLGHLVGALFPEQMQEAS
jgi:hypothetical protein